MCEKKIVNSVKVENRLDGASNFNSWKPKVLFALENDLLDFMQSNMVEPLHGTEKIQWKKNDIKDRKILIHSIRNHIVLIISKSKSGKEMFDTLKRIV